LECIVRLSRASVAAQRGDAVLAQSRAAIVTRVLAVLLLPQPFEALPVEHEARDLERADGVVAVDPPRMSYEMQSRFPGEVADAIATLQARRLLRAVDDPIGAVVLFDPRAYPLARGLLAIGRCELWYARAAEPEPEGSQRLRRRLRVLDEQARGRSTLRFTTTEPLWERMRELGVDVRVSRR
jgi:hypothetical protein